MHKGEQRKASENKTDTNNTVNNGRQVKPVRTPVAILWSLGVCIYVPASRHWLISYSPIHLTQPDVIV